MPTYIDTLVTLLMHAGYQFIANDFTSNTENLYAYKTLPQLDARYPIHQVFDGAPYLPLPNTLVPDLKPGECVSVNNLRAYLRRTEPKQLSEYAMHTLRMHFRNLQETLYKQQDLEIKQTCRTIQKAKEKELQNILNTGSAALQDLFKQATKISKLAEKLCMEQQREAEKEIHEKYAPQFSDLQYQRTQAELKLEYANSPEEINQILKQYTLQNKYTEVK